MTPGKESSTTFILRCDDPGHGIEGEGSRISSFGAVAGQIVHLTEDRNELDFYATCPDGHKVYVDQDWALGNREVCGLASALRTLIIGSAA